MNQKLLRKVQLEQLSIMDKIHKICVQHSIKYYIIGGTALGAVRHKGFIPWDVDIDIAMTRENYDKLSYIFKDGAIEGLKYYDYKSMSLYNPPHAIITKIGTELYREDKVYDKRFRPMGIFVDILPLDKAPDKTILRKIQATILTYIAKFKYLKIASHFDETSLHRKFVKTLARIAFSIISTRSINSVQQKIMQAFNSLNTKYLCSMSSHYSYNKQCMPASVYGEPTLIQFEDKTFFAPEQLMEYLKRIYGNYNSLPSISDQEAQKSYFSDAKFN